MIITTKQIAVRGRLKSISLYQDRRDFYLMRSKMSEHHAPTHADAPSLKELAKGQVGLPTEDGMLALRKISEGERVPDHVKLGDLRWAVQELASRVERYQWIITD